METRDKKAVAKEILRQMGGNRFVAMTGARNFTCDENSLGFRLPGTMTRDRINYVKVTLNSMDTYDIEFKAIRGYKVKDVDSYEGIYNDGLEAAIGRRTGLATRL